MVAKDVEMMVAAGFEILNCGGVESEPGAGLGAGVDGVEGVDGVCGTLGQEGGEGGAGDEGFVAGCWRTIVIDCAADRPSESDAVSVTRLLPTRSGTTGTDQSGCPETEP